jgi:hypothetical protein
MVTQEELDEIFGEDSTIKPFQNKGVDYDLIAINLLRERIPYEECRSIIGGAEHDVLYLSDTKYVMKYLSREDLLILADCNCCIDDELECIYLFV